MTVKLDDVFIGLASIPEREKSLEAVVNDLLPQCGQLGVYLNNYQNVPDFLTHEKISVARSQDHGDVRDNGKFYFLQQSKKRYYATADDDISYPADYIQRHLRYMRLGGPNIALFVHGFLLPEHVESISGKRHLFHFAEAAHFFSPVNVGGTGTLLFDQRALGISYEEFGTPGMADVWFSIAAKKRGASMFVVPRKKGWLSPLPEASSPTNSDSSAPARNLFDYFRGRDELQVQLLNENGMGGTLENYLKSLLAVKINSAQFSLTQAMIVRDIADRLKWDGLTDLACNEVRKLLRSGKRAFLAGAHTDIKKRISTRWNNQYVEHVLKLLLGAPVPDTASFAESIVSLLSGIEGSNLPLHLTWDARDDRQAQLGSHIAERWKSNSIRLKSPQHLSGTSPVFLRLGYEDLIALSQSGVTSDFLSHPDLSQIAKSKPDRALELVFRYLEPCTEHSKQSIPEIEWWKEFFVSHSDQNRVAIVASYLMSRAGKTREAWTTQAALVARTGLSLELLIHSYRTRQDISQMLPLKLRLSELAEISGFSISQKSMSREPKLSVIVTTHNEVENLELTVANILESDYGNLEIIVVDDFSDKEVRTRIEAFDFPKTKIIYSNRNSGPYVSRNLALSQACGKYVAFQDAGDVSSPGRFAKQIEMFAENPNIVISRTRHIRLDNNGRPLLENSLQYCGDAPVTMMMRRSLFAGVGLFLPTRTRGDIEMLRRVISVFGSNSVIQINFPMYFASSPKNSVSFDGRDVATFMKRAQSWHELVKMSPTILESWAVDRVLPLDIPEALTSEAQINFVRSRIDV
jgi:hypothetical protein